MAGIVLILLCTLSAVFAAPTANEGTPAGTTQLTAQPVSYVTVGQAPFHNLGVFPTVKATPIASNVIAPPAVQVKPLEYTGHVAHLSPVAPVAIATQPIAIQRTEVEIPVHKQVQYGIQNYVAGTHDYISKPQISALPISAPKVLVQKQIIGEPEITVKKQEVPVQKFTPVIKETPYHAGTVVEYTEPEVKNVEVQVAVEQPVAVPYSVPIAPIKQFVQTVPVTQPKLLLKQNPGIFQGQVVPSHTFFSVPQQGVVPVQHATVYTG